MTTGQLTWRDLVRLELQGALAAALNYAQGYAFSPVRRWRCCGHLVPGHAAACWLWQPVTTRRRDG